MYVMRIEKTESFDIPIATGKRHKSLNQTVFSNLI